VAFRWDANLVGQLVVVSYLPGETTVSYTMYHPSLIEWLAGGGVIAYGLTLFSLGVRYLHVVDHTIYEKEHEVVHETEPAGNTVPA
jgi:Ni/Fe-hydrogenase subunit HybB-like protein